MCSVKLYDILTENNALIKLREMRHRVQRLQPSFSHGIEPARADEHFVHLSAPHSQDNLQRAVFTLQNIAQNF